MPGFEAQYATVATKWHDLQRPFPFLSVDITLPAYVLEWQSLCKWGCHFSAWSHSERVLLLQTYHFSAWSPYQPWKSLNQPEGECSHTNYTTRSVRYSRTIWWTTRSCCVLSFLYTNRNTQPHQHATQGRIVKPVCFTPLRLKSLFSEAPVLFTTRSFSNVHEPPALHVTDPRCTRSEPQSLALTRPYA